MRESLRQDRSRRRRSAVAEVFADPAGRSRRLALAPGTFTLFKGDLSLLRVTEIAGHRRRIIALFSYDQRPDQVFEQSYIEELRSAGARGRLEAT